MVIHRFLSSQIALFIYLYPNPFTSFRDTVREQHSVRDKEGSHGTTEVDRTGR
jgi:hypothetical protein